MYCSNCGKEVSSGEKFCSECGKNLQGGNSENKNRSKNHILIIALLCCVFCVLIVGVFVGGILFNSYKTNTDVSEITVSVEEESEVNEKETGTTEKQVSTTEKTTTTTEKQSTTVRTTQATTKKPQSVTASPAAKKLPADSNGIVKPDSAIMGSRYYVYPSDGTILRSGPGTNYSEIMLLSQGTVVSEEGYRADSSGWMMVRLMNGSTYGWVRTGHLSTNNPGNNAKDQIYEYEKSFSTVVLAEDGLNLRSEPSESGVILGTIPYKRSINVIGYSAYDPGWIYVSVYLDGKTQYGFVSDSYVQH